MKKTFLILFMILISVLSLNSQAQTITIFFTGNTNGHPLPFKDMNEPDQGGIPARATIVKELGGNRYKNNVLLFDTGSVFEGRAESNIFNGRPDIAGMNVMKYDCAAIGITELQRTAKDFELLNQKCEFTYLGANVFFMNKITKQNELLSDDFMIKKIDGIKIGIFSVITEDVKYLLRPAYKSEYIISDPIKAANTMSSRLKREKNCDIIIALTHLGYYPDDETVIDSKALANNVKNIDMIIDGRTSINMQTPVYVNDIPIFQVGKWGLYLGEITVNLKNKKPASFNFKNHAVNAKINGKMVNDKKIKDDFITMSAIKAQMASYDIDTAAKICTIAPEFNFDISDIRFAECDFGNLLCDAILEYTEADLVLMNTGGINNISKVDSTKINRKSFDKVIEFDNPVVVIGMTGKEIADTLGYSVTRQGYGGFLQVAGINFEYNKLGEIVSVKKNGQPLDPRIQYRVAVNSWMIMGGDGYGNMKYCPIKTEASMLTREILYNYLEEKENIPVPKGGRIIAVE